MNFNKLKTSQKALIGVSIVFILLSIYLLIAPTSSLYEYENRNVISNDNQCALVDNGDIIGEKADIDYTESWHIDKGYMVKFDIKHIPEGHKLKVEKNDNLVEELNEKRIIEYEVEVDDEIVITQYVRDSGLSEEQIRTVITDN